MTNTFIFYEQDRKIESAEEDLFFFQRSDFINRHNEKILWFSLIENNKPLIRIAFSKDEKTAVSLSKSPFGSFHRSHQLQSGQLTRFAQGVLQDLTDLGFSTVRIINFPECYDFGQASIVHKVLTALGFEISKRINQYFVVDENKFSAVVKSDERRYLNKAEKLNFNFRKLDFPHLKAVYKLIKECRLAKGYSMTMTYKEVEETILQFPDQYLIFGVFWGNTLIASSISIVVNGDILYDFYHGDNLSYRKYSPVVLLIKGLYNYAQENGFKILDVGTSTEDGIYNFKKNLGALETLKYTYQKKIKP